MILDLIALSVLAGMLIVEGLVHHERFAGGAWIPYARRFTGSAVLMVVGFQMIEGMERGVTQGWDLPLRLGYMGVMFLLPLYGMVILDEKHRAQERRGDLVSRKLTWITGLFALGVIKLPVQIEARLVLYILPLIAAAFDLYIKGEDFGIKRMGSFVKYTLAADLEGRWEAYVATRRDIFSRLALPLSSLLVTLGAGVSLAGADADSPWYWIWVGVSIVLPVVVHVSAGKRLQKLEDEGSPTAEAEKGCIQNVSRSA